MLMRWFLAVSIAALAMAQELGLPHGAVTRLTSPDGAYTLYGVVDSEPQLWIENTRTQFRRKLLDVPGTLSARWSPDSRAFTVSYGPSDSKQAYIYDAGTLERLDVGSRILEADASARRFSGGHAYFVPESWEDAQHVIVRFNGHTDESPVVCFDFRYRVSRAGVVERLSQRSGPFGTCGFGAPQ